MEDFIIENGVLKKYIGTGGQVVIPERVTEIADNAFFGKEKVTAVTFPQSLRRIGKYAFGACPRLQVLELPEGVQEIDEKAFWWCSGLRRVCLPQSLRRCGSLIFVLCSSITHFVNNSRISFWEKDFFIPEHTGYNWDYTEDTWSYPPIQSGSMPYEEITELFESTKIPIPAISCYLSDRDAYDYDIARGYDIYIHGMKDALLRYYTENDMAEALVNLLSAVEVSPEGREAALEKATSFEMRALLLEMGHKTPVHPLVWQPDPRFSIDPFGLLTDCHAEGEAIQLPEGILQIANFAFVYTNEELEGQGLCLREILLPDSLRVITRDTFFSCDQLERLYIPAGVQWIEPGAFEDLTALKEITVDPWNTYYFEREGCLYEKSDRNWEKEVLLWQRRK